MCFIEFIMLATEVPYPPAINFSSKLMYENIEVLVRGRDSLVASTRAYHATGTGIDPQRGNVWNRSPTSAGVDFVCHLNSDATSFGWDVKPRSSPCSMRSIKHGL